MAWRPHGRAQVNPVAPRAFGTCDRCGMLYNLNDLAWQHQWRGNKLMNIWLRVCTLTCLDNPSDFLRPIKLPADPVPVYQPRPEPYTADENAGSLADPSFEVPD